MSVICFTSLKGGVGKTSLSINVAHAFAERGCKTVIIDFDPSAHATRFFKDTASSNGFSKGSPLAQLFLVKSNYASRENDDVIPLPSELFFSSEVPLIVSLRENLDLLPAGPELRHFLWGKGAKIFASFFPLLVRELRDNYDHIIIDTAPDFSVLTRNAIACSDLVTVPIDSSEMSINSLEELLSSAQHIKGPTWSIVRSMVNRQASRVLQLSSDRLSASLPIHSAPVDENTDEGSLSRTTDDVDDFVSMLRTREEMKKEQGPCSEGLGDSPIYLLRAHINRSEEINRLTFLGKTAFDNRSSQRLAEQYLAVARELEDMYAATVEPVQELATEEYLPSGPISAARSV